MLVRAGRFFPAHGINIPEHASVIKHGLRWDQGQEIYNLEVNYLKAESEQYERTLYGFHTIAAYNEKLYFLSELDWQKTGNAPNFGIKSTGMFNYNKIGYEIRQGVHANFTFEYGQSDLDNSITIITSYGPGFQFLPRHHFELSGVWTKQQIVAL